MKVSLSSCASFSDENSAVDILAHKVRIINIAMTVKKSKNLTYQKFGYLPDGSDPYTAAAKCILEKFEHLDTKLVLHFKNRYLAFIRANNLEGQREMSLLAKKLPAFIGKSYEEILNLDFSEQR